MSVSAGRIFGWAPSVHSESWRNRQYITWMPLCRLSGHTMTEWPNKQIAVTSAEYKQEHSEIICLHKKGMADAEDVHCGLLLCTPQLPWRSLSVLWNDPKAKYFASPVTPYIAWSCMVDYYYYNQWTCYFVVVLKLHCDCNVKNYIRLERNHTSLEWKRLSVFWSAVFTWWYYAFDALNKVDNQLRRSMIEPTMLGSLWQNR